MEFINQLLEEPPPNQASFAQDEEDDEDEDDSVRAGSAEGGIWRPSAPSPATINADYFNWIEEEESGCNDSHHLNNLKH